MTLPPRIGRYCVLDILGQGAMGVVYRGVDEALDRPVAIKVMSAGAGADAESRARFKREAQAAARLQHPNIVTIYELGEHEGAPFMALELLEGVDLQRAIESGLRPNPKATLPVVLQLLAGLGHAHEHGIVHRDVKPSNVFLPRGRPAKIMDFGVARLGEAITTTGMVVGTPNYMSPEQVRGGHLDGRSDLFSAGLILYELVTGEKAYRGDSVVALLFKIAHEDPDLSLIPHGAAWDHLRGILERALAREPDSRYPDAAAMTADLARALLDLGGSTDWAATSDLGLVVKTPTRPREMSLGTAAPPLAAPMALGTAPPMEPTRAAPPATQAWRSPMALAAVLVGAAILILAGALLQLARPPQAARPALSASPGLAPTASVAPTAPPASSLTTPAATPPSATLPSSRPSTGPPRPSPEATEAPPSEPPPATARVDRANDLLEGRRYAQALAEARAVLKREPRNAEAQTIAEEAEAALLVEAALKKATEALKKGDKDGAVEELKKGLAVNGNDARLLALWREATQ